MNPLSKMSRRSLLLAGLTVSVAALSGAEARRPASLDNLKGTYNGTFQQTGGGGSASGKLVLKIVSDKNRGEGSRAVKATARFGRKTYKLQGAFEPSTKQLNLGGVSGRPPQITQVSIMGHFDDEGRVLTALYSISSSSGANNGECTVTRKDR